jgi:GntR family transcriptional regulator, transcriptional repressor for pyruvate dehydrogenase complex
MPPATRARAFHAIVGRIHEDIFARRCRPGDRLPSEQSLGEQFGVSRAGVREALRVLELEGLVEVRHGYGGGVFVAEPSHTPFLGALSVSLRLGQVDAIELYQARQLVEPSIARGAAEGDTSRLLERLVANVEATDTALAAGVPISALNREFHGILAEQAGNRVLGLLMQALQELLESVDERFPNSPAVSRCALTEHRQILDAVSARDGERAERLMRCHLANLQDRLRWIADEPRAAPVPDSSAVPVAPDGGTAIDQRARTTSVSSSNGSSTYTG